MTNVDILVYVSETVREALFLEGRLGLAAASPFLKLKHSRLIKSWQQAQTMVSNGFSFKQAGKLILYLSRNVMNTIFLTISL